MSRFTPVRFCFFAALALFCQSQLTHAASVTATDGGTAFFGACNGVAIDFDATVAPNAVWTPSLVSGQSYTLTSVAIKISTGNSGSYYLGVYAGLSGGNLSGFKGVSDTAKDFSTSPNNWLTFRFSNLNYNLTVDSTAGSGSGLLYFVYQSGTSAITSPNITLATDKFGTDTSNPLAPPQVSPVSLVSGSQLMLQIGGASGPDYQIQASKDLVDWSAVFTTNPPSMPLVWTNNINERADKLFPHPC